MRIVIDGRMMYWTGVGRYTTKLLECLQELDHENEYVVLMRQSDWGLWSPKVANFRKLEVNINPYTFGEQLQLAWVLYRLRPDLVHFTAVNAPLLYLRQRVVTIHDVTLLGFDTSRGRGWRRWLRGIKKWPFRLVMWWQARFSPALITPTQYVKDELVRRYSAPADKITVTHLAADAHLAKPAPLTKFGLKKQFLLNIGNAYPYKNMTVAIQALQLLQTQYPGLQLVVTARPGFFREQLENQAQELGVRDQVIFTGFVSDGEMVALYQQAAVYVHPSLSEGFGLEVLEAMIEGTPVIAAEASCLPEIGGEAAIYFDPQNPEQLAEKIHDVLSDPARREQLAEAGRRRAAQFSWQATTQQTLTVYNKNLS